MQRFSATDQTNSKLLSRLLKETLRKMPTDIQVHSMFFDSCLTGHLYVKSDVYGFGVVLVEMLTGLRALDTNRPTGQRNLTDWIKPHLSDRRKLKNTMDTRLEGKYPSKAAVQIAQLALTCLAPEPKTRPSMKEVLDTLERIESADEKPKERRVKPTRQTAHRHGQQHLHHRSALHPRNGGHPSYPLPQRA